MVETNQTKSQQIVISKDSLLKTARLARLQLDDSLAEVIQGQIGEACASFQQINAVDVTGVEPLLSPLEEQPSLRPDVVQSDGVTEAILERAPDLQGRLFRVPPVV